MFKLYNILSYTKMYYKNHKIIGALYFIINLYSINSAYVDYTKNGADWPDNYPGCAGSN